MPMFRTRPQIVEALLFQGQKTTDSGLPQWYVDSVLAARIRLGPKENMVDTINGAARCNVGDWIVRDAHGIYPMRNDVFRETYEPIQPGSEVEAPPPLPPVETAPVTDESRGVNWPIQGA